MFIEFLVEAEDAVAESEFQKLDEFICRDLADIGKIGAGRNFGIDNLQCNRYWNAGEESTGQGSHSTWKTWKNRLKPFQSWKYHGILKFCKISWKKEKKPGKMRISVHSSQQVERASAWMEDAEAVTVVMDVRSACWISLAF